MPGFFRPFFLQERSIPGEPLYFVLFSSRGVSLFLLFCYSVRKPNHIHCVYAKEDVHDFCRRATSLDERCPDAVFLAEAAVV